jgi:SAM-dependent methyltransferase
MIAAVSKLYNDLFDIESVVNKGIYPIHKKLKTEEDIYEKIIKQFSIPVSGIILDAGCGVGYGTNIIAANTSDQVEGISISDKEIERAKKNNKYPGQCNFYKQSFEELTNDKYAIIICVESLKHALDHQLVFNKLHQALKENGKLIIVDDFYLGNEVTDEAKQFMKDWELTFLINEKSVVPLFNHESTIDLTDRMQKKNKIKTQVKLLTYRLLKESSFTKLFRGGTILDKLYSQALMKYAICIYNKN